MSTRYTRRHEWGLLAFYGAAPLVCSVVGAVVVGVIALKSRFGTQFGPMTTTSLQYGIVLSLCAAVGWALLALVWRRLLWLAGLSVACAVIIFFAHYSGIVCTSKKARICDPLFSFLDPRPAMPWRQR